METTKSHAVRPARVLLATALLLAGACAQERPAATSILLISLDTLRADHLGCYGHPHEISPRIDAFAREGVVFEDVTSASPWTLPAHASMLSGLYPSSHGVQTKDDALAEESLATWLRDAGYQTFAAVNTIYIGWPAFGLLRGFRRVEHVPEILESGGPILNRAEDVLSSALGMLEARDPDRPFFLLLHIYDPHTDLTPAPRWQAEFVEPYDGPLTGLTLDLRRTRTRIWRGEQSFGERDAAYLRQLYEAEIRTLDEHLGRLFDYLGREGLLETTLVAITSDHGEEYGEHGGLLHGHSHYQELVRVPWILRGPGVPAGRRVADPVHLVDVAPTLLALAGQPPLPRTDGLDASLAWRAPDGLPESRLLFSEADHTDLMTVTLNNVKKMVREGDLVLHWDLRTGRKELYDLASDPGERRDLAAERPQDVARLSAELERFRQREGSAPGSGELPPESERMLRALGY